MVLNWTPSLHYEGGPCQGLGKLNHTRRRWGLPSRALWVGLGGSLCAPGSAVPVPTPSSVGTFARALDCSSSVRQPSLHMSAAAASRDITLVSGDPGWCGWGLWWLAPSPPRPRPSWGSFPHQFPR